MRPGENRLEERDFGQEIVAGELKFREDEINLYLSAGLVMGVTDRNRLRALCICSKIAPYESTDRTRGYRKPLR